MGQAGFMLGAVWQPLDVEESTTFYDADMLHLMDQSALDYEELSIKHRGPARIMF